MKIGRISAAVIAAFLGMVAVCTSQASDPPGAATDSARAAALSSAAFSATSAPAAAHDLTAADVEAWLNGLMNYGLQNGDIAGAEISIVKDGKVLFQSGYGYADVETKTPMDPERVLTRIGSTSKLFTWTAVMQLVEQGKLDLNRNVDDYLDFKVSPPGGKPITLLDLMNHRGGFEEGLKDLLTFDPESMQSTETYLKQHPRPLIFAPGTVPAYSNYGAALAGYIVQRVSGEPYASYIENHIFQPLRMQHSTFVQPLPDSLKGMMSHGYRTASEAPLPYELVVTAPAGSVASTAADMAHFMLAQLQHGHLESHDILNSQTAQLMLSPSEQALPGFATMAHGFFYETHNGRLLIGHGGDTIVFHTEFDLLPEEGVGIFYSFNSRGRDQAVYGLRKAVLDQFMDRYFPAPAAVSASAPAAPATPTLVSESPSTSTSTSASVSASGSASAAAAAPAPASGPAHPEPVSLASATSDAQKIAGRYESSRRVEHGLLSVFYLLQQTVISATPDGTVLAPKTFEPGEAHFHEVAPDVWQENGGTHRLALRTINGVKTILDSEDPTSVLQAVPTSKSAPLNLTVLIGSFVLLTLTVILWPVLYFARRHYRATPIQNAEARRSRTVLRIAAVFDVVWLVCWALVLLPVISTQLDFYSSAHDSLIRTLQAAGLVVVAFAAVGLWSLWRVSTLGATWPARIGNGLIVASLLGLVWIGFVGGLISFNLNY